jgi:hypothetical protein
MTSRIARRRWTRELELEVDGVHLGTVGAVIVHGYEDPAGGKWHDSVIPAKVGAFDRQSGERLWLAPCEIGYGRGFGAGFSGDNQVLVLGPSANGHRAARITADSGELLALEDVGSFDDAHVDSELCVCVAPQEVFALRTKDLSQLWRLPASGRRFHLSARGARHLFVAHSEKGSRLQGVGAVDLESGKRFQVLIPANQPAVLGLAAGGSHFAVLGQDLEQLLPEDRRRDLQLERLLAEEERSDDEASEGRSGGRGQGGLAIFEMATAGARLAWHRDLSGRGEDSEAASLAMDSGKVYLASGASLLIFDALTGRELGSLVVPGLDEHVSWTVRDGAFLLAEENRLSIFEVPD